jgi:hypothetical protein
LAVVVGVVDATAAVVGLEVTELAQVRLLLLGRTTPLLLEVAALEAK